MIIRRWNVRCRVDADGLFHAQSMECNFWLERDPHGFVLRDDAIEFLRRALAKIYSVTVEYPQGSDLIILYDCGDAFGEWPSFLR